MSNAILAWAQAFATALVPPLFALGLVWLRQHQINTQVIEAVGRAAGEAYRHIVQSGGLGADPGSWAAAVAQGRAYMLARIPDALAAAGVTPEAAAQMVSAELGKLLAVDPTVGVGKAAGDPRPAAADHGQ
ncbi:MAG: hypothetical protein JO047_07180 [Alphaproteobacteria bacterium]|nr:hypothetical protein [Alphaproteobacteria bacterium]